MRVGGLAQLSRRRDTDTSRCLQIMTCVLLQHALSRFSRPPTKSWSWTLRPRSYFRPHAPSATSKHLSEEGDYDCAARWGAGPWKVGVLAGLLFGFDVFVGRIDPATVAASPRLSLQREHIRRARELHGLLEHMRAAWAVNSDAFTAPEQVLLQDPEFVAGLAPGMGGCRPRKRATARSSRRRRRLLQRMPFALLGIGEQCLQRGTQAN